MAGGSTSVFQCKVKSSHLYLFLGKISLLAAHTDGVELAEMHYRIFHGQPMEPWKQIYEPVLSSKLTPLPKAGTITAKGCCVRSGFIRPRRVRGGAGGRPSSIAKSITIA